MATRGNNGESSIPITNSTWIIDSGATDHMTFDSRQISSMKPSSKELISTANGNTTSVIGKGSLTLTNNLTLDSILVVPSLEYNLLFVSQITTALDCVVIFWPNFCVFKDIQTKQTIGYGVKRGRLYYLDLGSKDSRKLESAFMVNSATNQKEEVEMWLWHRRLGHASFGYLKKLFPLLFAKCDVSVFHCDVCEQAKSHRVPFPLSLNKSLVPFMLIHSDVWGPSKISTLRGSCWFVTFINDCTRMTWLWLMKSKGEVNLIFQKFHKMIET
uniref:Retrovirus-related Pol polyprotein from transposon TNT 1-94 n=1 Tax=Cajanus cajan TaxID=3821 RepID=A0A151S7X1_CAJCA|nr:Retrovirus-related Pol polyprotein from transposon TNT 1-94 [Cajanus cajan]